MHLKIKSLNKSRCSNWENDLDRPVFSSISLEFLEWRTDTFWQPISISFWHFVLWSAGLSTLEQAFENYHIKSVLPTQPTTAPVLGLQKWSHHIVLIILNSANGGRNTPNERLIMDVNNSSAFWLDTLGGDVWDWVMPHCHLLACREMLSFIVFQTRVIWSKSN